MLKRSPTKEKVAASNPLHEAVRSKKISELKKQLSKKSAKDYILELDHGGCIPLALAIKENLYVFVEELLNYYGRNLVNINFTDQQKNTVLHKACSEPILDERILIALLRFPGIDVHLQNLDGNTPLHLLCEKFSMPTVVDHLNVFFSLGAEINVQNEFGESLLHKACLNNSVRLLLTKALLQRKADPNLTTQMGETPLHYAVRMNREDLAMTLIRAGARLDIRGGRKKQTPLELAESGSMAKLATKMRKVEDIFAWMRSVSPVLFDNFATKFLEEEIYLDTLAYVTAPMLEKMGIKDQSLISAVLDRAREHQEKKVEEVSFTGARHSRSISDTNVKIVPAVGKDDSNAEAANGEDDGIVVLKEPTVPGTRMPTFSRTVERFHGSNSASPPSDAPQNFRSSARKERPKSMVLPQQIEIRAHEIEFLECAGVGSVSKVFRSLYGANEVVATKVFKVSEETRGMLQKELNVICSLFHPNIALVYGMCQDLSLAKHSDSSVNGLMDCVLVTEFCDNDTLYTVMSNSLVEITWPRFFRWSIQLTSALAFLHSSQPSMIHHNVKSLNALISKNWNLKLCDIGKAQFFFKSSVNGGSLAIASSFPWFAPEVLEKIVITENEDPMDPTDVFDIDIDNAPFSAASDVYSAGIVIWELLRRTLGGSYVRPWEGEHDLPPSSEPVELRNKVLKLEGRFHRPYLLRDSDDPSAGKQCVCPPKIADLYDMMTAKNPYERPNAAYVVEALKQMFDEYSSVPEVEMDWDARRRVVDGAKPIAGEKKSMHFPPTQSCIAKVSAIPAALANAGPIPEEWDDEPGTSRQHKMKALRYSEGRDSDLSESHKQHRKHRHDSYDS